MSSTRNENLGYLLGLIGVVAFAVTLPVTRAAVQALDPVFVFSAPVLFIPAAMSAPASLDIPRASWLVAILVVAIANVG